MNIVPTEIDQLRLDQPVEKCGITVCRRSLFNDIDGVAAAILEDARHKTNT